MLTLRKAEWDDCDFAFRVRQAAFPAHTSHRSEAEELALHEDRFARLDFRVVLSEGQGAGIVALGNTAESLFIHQLYLLPEFQGRGIGREAAELILAEAEGRPVRLRVKRTNARAASVLRTAGLSGERCYGHALSYGMDRLSFIGGHLRPSVSSVVNGRAFCPRVVGLRSSA